MKFFFKQGGNFATLAASMVNIKTPLTDLFKGNVSNITLNSCKSNFYKQILQYWCKLVYNRNLSPSEIINKPLWINGFIQVDNKPVYFCQWYMKGITYMKDIIDENGSILSKSQIEHKYNKNKTNGLQ